MSNRPGREAPRRIGLVADTDASPPGAASSRGRRSRIAVIGEFNSGKTALVNMLAGAPVLTPGIAHPTLHPTVVAFAAAPSLRAETADRRRLPTEWDRLGEMASQDVRRVHVGVPLTRLKRFSVLDTPGLGSGDRSIDRRSLQACCNADTVIWCTPAMQAWKASEEQAWLTLSERQRRRGLLAVTFADEIASSADMARLMDRLETEAGPYFQSVAVAEACVAAVLAEVGAGEINPCSGR